MCSELSFVVIGISDEGMPNFSAEILKLISSRRVFSGGVRHYELVRELLPLGHEWINVTIPLSAPFERYRAVHDEIVVFASGDPLFFGYTTTLMREFPGLVRHTYPHFNSLQLLAHALCLPYHDMRVCSLTGRPWHEFDRALIECTPKLGVLTDKRNTPAVIAQHMLDYGYDGYRMHVGVRLGGAHQQVYTLSLGEATEQEFDHPNCLIIEATRQLDFCPRLGIGEGEFHLLNGRAKMITKMPIRLLSLSMLELHKRRTLWDVGFCTGSVSVEARLQFPHLEVTSFEIRPEGDELMRTNSRRFGAPGIQYYIGDFMAHSLEGLVAPEAVFIGGHGGALEAMLVRLAQHIAPDGVIVFNSVSAETLDLFRSGIQIIGWHITQEMCLTLDDHNPITILQAKPNKQNQFQ